MLGLRFGLGLRLGIGFGLGLRLVAKINEPPKNCLLFLKSLPLAQKRQEKR